MRCCCHTAMLPGRPGRVSRLSTGKGSQSYKCDKRHVTGSRARGDGGNAFAFKYVPPETEYFPEPPKERERHAGHCDDVQHHVVRLLPPAEEPAGP
ncbi:hypothetical protein GCM10009536_57580 [Streptomyces thermocarboxydus]